MERAQMTSDEIRQRQATVLREYGMAKCADDLNSIAQILALYEIALQLALMNEANAPRKAI
jgi:hypothetical protein